MTYHHMTRYDQKNVPPDARRGTFLRNVAVLFHELHGALEDHAVGFESVKVHPARHVGRVEGDVMRSGGHGSVHERCDSIACQIEHAQEYVSIGRDSE